MADEKPKSAAAKPAGGESTGAAQDPATGEALDANRDQRQAADEQAGKGGRVALPDQEAPTVVQTRTLAGVQPAGVREAGGEAQHAELVAGDPHAHESTPGAQGIEAVGSGTPVPQSAAEAMRDRANAGIPEPPKVGPVQNVSLYDTPGGYQTVPAGYTPEETAGFGSTLAPRAGTAVRRPFGEEAGAENRHIAGAAPGAKLSDAQ